LTAEAASRQSTNSVHWASLFQFALSGIVLAGLWGLAAISVVNNFLTSNIDGTEAFGVEWFAAFGYFTLGVLLIPSTVLSLRRIIGHSSRQISIPGGRFGLVIFLIPILLGIGTLLLQNDLVGWLAPLHILVGLLSIAWLLWLAIRNLEPGSGQRAWGALGAGMTLTPFFAIVLEIIGALFLLVILAIYISTNPELTGAVERISGLVNRINPNMELIIQQLQPLFNDPFVLILTLSGLGLFVPLIEELFKPIGVMLLLGRKLTPAQGFALGAICGAGYALIENLTIGADGETWALVSIGRFGTSAMHILTTALSGYALVRAKNEKRWLQLLGVYALNVFVHGLWNSLVVINSVAIVSGENGQIPAGAICFTLPMLVLVAFGSIFFLRRMNRGLSNMDESRFPIAPPNLENL
jgi:hypothetical protein